MVNLTPEQIAALRENPKGIPCRDESSQSVYYLVDEETHHRAMEALRRIEDSDAIAAGIADMEAGRSRPLNEAMAELRQKLGFPSRDA